MSWFDEITKNPDQRYGRVLPASLLLLLGHTNAVWSVAFLPDGEQVISGSYDRSIRAWRIEDGREVGSAMRDGGAVFVVAASSDGQWIASGGSAKTIAMWNAKTHEKLNGHSTGVRSLAFSPDSARIMSGCNDGTVIVWSTTTGKRLLGPLNGHTSWVQCISFTWNGDKFATCDDRDIRVWNSHSGKLVIPPIQVDARSLAWTPNGQLLIAGCGYGSIKFFDPRTGSLLTEWNGHNNVVMSIAVSPTGKFMASASWDHKIRLWDTATCTQIGPTLQHYDDVNSVAISPDGSHLAGAGDDNKVRIWSLKAIVPPSFLDNTPTTPNNSPRLNGDFQPVPYPPRESQHLQSTNDDNDSNKVAERDRSKGDAAVQRHPNRSSSGQSILKLAHKKVKSSTGLQSSELSRLPRKSVTNCKPKDPGPSVPVAGCNIMRPGNSVAEAFPAFDQGANGHGWNLDDLRFSFPNDLTDYVVREGEHPIASGSYGDVYRGTLRTSGRSIEVAVKAIRTYSTDDGDYARKKKRLRREIRVWLNLEHVNVLPLFGTTMGFGKFPAMVCPWREHGPLSSFLERRDDNLTTVERLVLIGDVILGLQYLHSRSVVHGDLSGSNVLVHDNGRACIADFGLSTLLTELEGSSFSTSFHARGTLRWAAPELLSLNVHVSGDEENIPQVPPTPRSDTYAFGGIMLQVLTGKIPYHYYPRDERVLLALSRGETPKRPSGAMVTDRRWAFIERCWTSVESRPSDDEIVEFAKNELVQVVLPRC